MTLFQRWILTLFQRWNLTLKQRWKWVVFQTLKSITLYQRWKLVFQRRDQNSALKHRWNNLCAGWEVLLKFKWFFAWSQPVYLAKRRHIGLFRDILYDLNNFFYLRLYSFRVLFASLQWCLTRPIRCFFIYMVTEHRHTRWRTHL